MSTLIQCDIFAATHVARMKDENNYLIASKWGIGPGNRLARPSEGGFGCVTDKGLRISMYEARRYFRLVPEDPFMTQWAVFKNPRDYPGKFVAREFAIFRSDDLAGIPHATAHHVVADTLDEIHEQLPHGLVLMAPSGKDSPQTIEVWI